MSKSISFTALIQLSRYQEYVQFVTINTLLGLLVTPTLITTTTFYTFILVLIANLLAVCSSFMINDVEDADDDAQNPDKINRNPVSAGRITKKQAWIVTILISILSIIFYLLINPLVFFIGTINVIIGLLYSWKITRLKKLPIIDVLTHMLFLGGLLFLTSYLSFIPNLQVSIEWILPVLFISAISARGELVNELRDFTYDKQAGLKHTAVFIGPALATPLMHGFGFLGFITFMISVIMGIIPLGVLPAIVLFFGISYAYMIKFPTGNSQKNRGDLFNDAGLLSILLALISWLILKTF